MKSQEALLALLNCLFRFLMAGGNIQLRVISHKVNANALIRSASEIRICEPRSPALMEIYGNLIALLSKKKEWRFLTAMGETPPRI